MFSRFMMILGASGAQACSHFTMENNYVISARTEDLPGAPHFVIITKPRGSKGIRASRYGYVAFMDTNVRSGMNDVGLMCDKQTLEAASHPPHSDELDNIDSGKICQWALEGFGSIQDLKAGLNGVNFITSADPKFEYDHWAFRDADGQGLVIEFTNSTMQVYDDNNDGGKTGYGIMTNDPPFPEHLDMIAELKKQEQSAPQTLKLPGDWSSVDRFQRIFLIKSNMPVPSNGEDALMQAVHVLNSVSVPYDDAFNGWKTQWAVVYDQKNLALYWRSHNNQNLQRVRLSDMDLAEGGAERELLVNSSNLPWFSDASSLFHSKTAGFMSMLV